MMTENMTTIHTTTSTYYDQPTLLDRVGNTPLFRLNRITSDLPEHVEFLAKAEWFNPSGSSKDRPASQIIRKALSTGELHPGKVLLDSTSGNMGIAYATFGSALGIPVRLAIPSNASLQRIQILRALGADLIFTDPLEGSDGARIVAANIAAKNPEDVFFANQYNNPENWKAHYTSTGPEILAQTSGHITHFVAGLGTSGTMMGTGRYLHDHSQGVRLIAVQPNELLHGLEGLKDMQTSHRPEIFDPSLPDETIKVNTEDAYRMARRLAKEEGLLVGISAAAAVNAALQVARNIEQGLIVVLLPDSAQKYLDLPFWSE
jgi:cysteine synthase B